MVYKYQLPQVVFKLLCLERVCNHTSKNYDYKDEVVNTTTT
jgi:hypothetical protein